MERLIAREDRLHPLSEGAPERRGRALGRQESLDEQNDLGGMRRETPADQAIAIATEHRRLAGVTGEETQRLVESTPRRPVH